MTQLLDILDGPWPDQLRFAVSVWFLVIAGYLLWCGRQLQAEQAAADRLTGGAPPTLTGEKSGGPPPGPRSGKGSRTAPGGISHPERLRVERL